jgi:hypothetical protein
MAPPDLGPLGPPPHDLHRRALVVADWSASLYRVHRVDRDASYFGTAARNRFDDRDGEFGVLYASADLDGGFSETFAGALAVSVGSMMTTYGWSVMALHRDLRLCDLREVGLARIGADGRLCTGSRQDAQRWSRAIWTHPIAVDGICYPARTNLARTSIAVFDRAREALDVRFLGSFLDPRNEQTTAGLLDRYGVALIPG